MDAKIRSSLRNRNFRLHGSGNEEDEITYSVSCRIIFDTLILDPPGERIIRIINSLGS